ncbi:MAG: S1C family serine protease [Polyangiaceae bacterium]
MRKGQGSGQGRRRGLVLAGLAGLAFTVYVESAAAQPAKATPAAPASPTVPTREAAATAPKSAPGATSSGAAASAPRSRERNAIVEIQLQNKTVSLGFVLDGDGRILTTLSPLGRGVGLRARFADGSFAKLRVLHADRGWDLALLTPDDQRWTTGLLAARTDPFQDGGPLRLLRLDARGGLKEVALSAPHRENLMGGDAAVLSQALTFTPAFTAADLGAPILDAGGAVVGMVTQACLPAVLDRCSVTYYAAPTAELRRFLREGLTAQNIPMPWLGLTVTAETGGPLAATRIQSVLPNSPASTLGLRAGKQGDLLLAVNGTPVGSPKDLAELLHRHRAFDRVTLLLLAEGRYREVRVTLGQYPEAARPNTGAGLGQPDLGY